MGNSAPKCPICACPLKVGIAKGRKSGKAFVMLRCPVDGRHFRGFITDRQYTARFLGNLETAQKSTEIKESGG